jgi:hypothetical protein
MTLLTSLLLYPHLCLLLLLLLHRLFPLLCQPNLRLQPQSTLLLVLAIFPGEIGISWIMRTQIPNLQGLKVPASISSQETGASSKSASSPMFQKTRSNPSLVKFWTNKLMYDYNMFVVHMFLCLSFICLSFICLLFVCLLFVCLSFIYLSFICSLFICYYVHMFVVH